MTNCQCLCDSATEAAFSRTGFGKHPGGFRRRHLAAPRPAAQQPNVNKVRLQIHLINQTVDSRVDIAANLAAFASACPPLVAALRGACHPDKSPRQCQNAIRVQGFLAAEMKEYDA
jgi:hypothetical protein